MVLCFFLFRRHMAYSQPRSSLRWVSRFFIAGIMSIIFGTIFSDIPATDPQLSFGDRYKIPLMFIVISDDIEFFFSEWDSITVL